MAESGAWLVSTKRRTERKWGARIGSTLKMQTAVKGTRIDVTVVE